MASRASMASMASITYSLEVDDNNIIEGSMAYSLTISSFLEININKYKQKNISLKKEKEKKIKIKIKKCFQQKFKGMNSTGSLFRHLINSNVTSVKR